MKFGVLKFYEQVKQEVKKIVWPTKKELTTSVTIVVAAVLLISLITMLLDYGIHSAVQLLLNIGK